MMARVAYSRWYLRASSRDGRLRLYLGEAGANLSWGRGHPHQFLSALSRRFEGFALAPLWRMPLIRVAYAMNLARAEAHRS